MSDEKFISGWTFLVKKHLRNAVYSNVWIALGAGMATFQTTLLLGQKSWLLSVFVALSTFFIYNFQRVLKLNMPDGHYIPGRNNWLIRNQKFIVVLTALSGIIMLGIGTQLLVRDWILMAIPAVVSMWYAAQLRIGSIQIEPLRHVPQLKLYLIGITWAVSLVALPFIHYYGWNVIGEFRFILMFAECFAFVVAITIPFDIRDSKMDPAHFKTLPQKIGGTRAKIVGVGWLLSSSISAFGMLYIEAYTFWYALGMVLVNALAALLILKTTDEKSEMYYTGWIDGTIVLKAAIAILTLSVGNV